MKHIKHVKYILPSNRYIKLLPDYSVFGRKTTLGINPDLIPDLHWSLTDTHHTTGIGHTDTQSTDISAYCIDVKTLSHAKGDRCGEW